MLKFFVKIFRILNERKILWLWLVFTTLFILFGILKQDNLYMGVYGVLGTSIYSITIKLIEDNNKELRINIVCISLIGLIMLITSIIINVQNWIVNLFVGITLLLYSFILYLAQYLENDFYVERDEESANIKSNAKDESTTIINNEEIEL